MASIDPIFFADGISRDLQGVILYHNTGRVDFRIAGGEYDLTDAFEAEGSLVFESSAGQVLVLVGITDPSEPYSWVPSNSAEVILFVTHVVGLSDQVLTMTLNDDPPGANVAFNTAALRFSMPVGEWVRPTHFGIWATSGSGSFIAGDSLSALVSAPQVGETVEFPPQTLTVVLPAGEWSAAGVSRGLGGFVGGTVYISLHSSSPGSTGDNELSGNGYSRAAISAGNWTIS